MDEVVIVRMDVNVTPLAGLGVDGLNEHVAPDGSPVQEKLTAVHALGPVTVIVVEAPEGLVARTEMGLGLAAMEATPQAARAGGMNESELVSEYAAPNSIVIRSKYLELLMHHRPCSLIPTLTESSPMGLRDT